MKVDVQNSGVDKYGMEHRTIGRYMLHAMCYMPYCLFHVIVIIILRTAVAWGDRLYRVAFYRRVALDETFGVQRRTGPGFAAGAL